MTLIETKRATLALCLAAALPATAALGQDAPQFMQQTWPEAGLAPAWQEFQSVFDPDGALDGMTKELIGLAVSAQVPCDYCVYYHTEAAKQHGATDEQIAEALASAALVRKWSTALQGSQYDEDTWREQVDAMFAQ